MIEDKIREVMDLVSDWGMKEHLSGEAHLDAHDPDATKEEHDYADFCISEERSAWHAIESKLRELLEEKQEPQWESIDSAPKEDLILAFQKRWCFAEWSVLHECWFEEDAPVGGRLNPSHWMPVPPDPCK